MVRLFDISLSGYARSGSATKLSSASAKYRKRMLWVSSS